MKPLKKPSIPAINIKQRVITGKTNSQLNSTRNTKYNDI